MLNLLNEQIESCPFSQRLLRSLAEPPEPLEAERIAGYVAGAWPAASRIVAEP